MELSGDASVGAELRCAAEVVLLDPEDRTAGEEGIKGGG